MKKWVCIIIIAVLVLISGIIMLANKNSAKAEDSLYLKLNDKCDNLPEGFGDNQHEANEITNKFFKSLAGKHGWAEGTSAYTVNGLYAEAFPSYYAGAYINIEGKLVLQITEDYYSDNYQDSDWYSEFVEIVGSENFYCNPVTFSYSQLINAMTDLIMGDIHDELQEAGIVITGAGISDYKNHIDVYVKTQEDYDYIIDKLDPEVYSIEILDCTINNYVGLYSGGGITNSSFSGFSAACRVRKNLPYGQYIDGFLTCAHSFSGTSNVYINPATQIGVSYSTEQKYTSTADVAFIETNSSTTLYNTVYLSTTILNPSYSTVAEGAVVYKTGQATGTTYGVVHEDSQMGYDDNNVYCSDLVWVFASASNGDSGGIVYTQPDSIGHADCLGIVKGGAIGTMLYTKMYNNLGALQSGPVYYTIY